MQMRALEDIDFHDFLWDSPEFDSAILNGLEGINWDKDWTELHC